MQSLGILEQVLPREGKARAKNDLISVCQFCQQYKCVRVLDSGIKEIQGGYQVEFAEHKFPFRKRIVEQFLRDDSVAPTDLAIIIINLIVNSAASFCLCSLCVLKQCLGDCDS